MVVTISITTGMAFGLTFAMVSGYYGGIVDEVLMRIVDVWNALPFLMVALVLTLIFGRGLNIMILVLFLVAWVNFVRIIRAQILVLKEMDYIASAKICGASDVRIMVKHLFPGILIFILIRIISPIKLIRFGMINSHRIGHFTLEWEIFQRLKLKK